MRACRARNEGGRATHANNAMRGEGAGWGKCLLLTSALLLLPSRFGC